jgi:hypothetical protein
MYRMSRTRRSGECQVLAKIQQARPLGYRRSSDVVVRRVSVRPAEVYCHAPHSFNVDRMLEASRESLEFFTKHFGPPQFRQFRILEFPRYRRFAQSFPNTVRYSGGLGFIAHPKKNDDPDVSYYVHELGHQWCGHQVVGGSAQGSHMLPETLPTGSSR